jgi:hypothetical protein
MVHHDHSLSLTKLNIVFAVHQPEKGSPHAAVPRALSETSPWKPTDTRSPTRSSPARLREQGLSTRPRRHQLTGALREICRPVRHARSALALADRSSASATIPRGAKAATPVSPIIRFRAHDPTRSSGSLHLVLQPRAASGPVAPCGRGLQHPCKLDRQRSASHTEPAEYVNPQCSFTIRWR